MDRRQTLCAALCAAILLLLSLPLWLRITAYPFRALIPLATIAFLWLDLKQLRDIPARTSRTGIACSIFAIAVYLYQLLTAVHLNTALIWIPVAFACSLWAIQGGQKARQMSLSIAFLIFLLPSAGFWHWLIAPLKTITIHSTIFLLDVCGFSIYKKGDTLVLSQTTIAITDRCAGVGFFSKMLLFAFVIGLLGKFRHRHRWLLLFAAPFFAIFANILRITLYCFTATYELPLRQMQRLDVCYGAALFFASAVGLALLARYLNFYMQKSSYVVE